MKKTIFLLLSIALIASCSKEEVSPVLETTSQTILSGFEKEAGRRYLEFACVDEYANGGGSFAGTLCKDGQGNCKKKRPCTPVKNPASNATNPWSIAEEHVILGVAEGYFDADGYDELLRVAHEAALLQADIENK